MAKSKGVLEVSDSEVIESNSVESELVEMEVDKDGNTFLPGTAPIVIKELVDAVIELETNLKPAFASARDALIAKKNEISEISRANIGLFSEPDEKGVRVYKAGGIEVKITFEKEKILTKLEEGFED